MQETCGKSRADTTFSRVGRTLGHWRPILRPCRLRFVLNGKEVRRVRSEPPEVPEENDTKASAPPGTLVNCGNKVGGDRHLWPHSLPPHIPLYMRTFYI